MMSIDTNGKFLLLIMHVVAPGIITSSSEDRIEQVCLSETMQGRCRWKSEVIVVTSARWGRMRTGRCLEVHPNFMATHGSDPLFLNCSEDVLSVMDEKCSGRSECDIRIPDPELDNIKPCYPELKYYLEISYICVPVVPDSRSCTVSVTNQAKYISSSFSISDSSTMSNCGTRSNPWHLEAPIGQRVDIQLLDFTRSANKHDVTCHHYGYVVDYVDKSNVSICSRTVTASQVKLKREINVFITNTNKVDIVLFGESNSRSVNNFLVKLEAVGCSNMIPPGNAWMTRTKNAIVVGCYLSQQTWQLECDGHEWKGHVGTCPETYDGQLHIGVELVAKEEDRSLANGSIIVVGIIVVAALVICSTVIAIGCYCSRRYRNKSEHKLMISSPKSEQTTLTSKHQQQQQQQQQLHQQQYLRVDC